jgi:hypothetical protein
LNKHFSDLGECTKDTYKKLLADNTKKITDDDLKKTLHEGYFHPQKTTQGSGTEKLLHMTYVFQIFVFMQVFN